MPSPANHGQWLFLLVFLLPGLAQAHPEGSDTGLINGLLHPVFGLDHLLAMVSVGVVSVQLGGSNVWRLPLTFVGAMTGGAILGIQQVVLRGTELGIDVSVLVLGTSIVLAHRRTRPWAITVLVGVFGACHGYAHGLEIPKSISPALYTLGFVIGTAVLHILGMVVAEVATMKTWLGQGLRLAGVAVAVSGAVFLVQTLAVPA
jgi:urease accessory protein